jgi:hypothetical protein
MFCSRLIPLLREKVSWNDWKTFSGLMLALDSFWSASEKDASL